MFITAEEGKRGVNLKYVTDIEITGGQDPVESDEHPYKIVVHTTTGHTIELTKNKSKLVAQELLRTYLRNFNQSDSKEIAGNE